MPSWFRPSLTYANVIATLALFIALGGSGYAATQLSGKQIKKRSIAGTRLKKNTVGGTEIKESKLKQVPRARLAAGAANAELLVGVDSTGFLRATGKAADAETLDGLDSADFKVRCPSDTMFFEGACMERTGRPVQNYGTAAGICRNAGRRLPGPEELMGLRLIPRTDVGFGEWTAAESLDTDELGVTRLYATVVDAAVAAPFPRAQTQMSDFRCVATPTG